MKLSRLLFFHIKNNIFLSSTRLLTEKEDLFRGCDTKRKPFESSWTPDIKANHTKKSVFMTTCRKVYSTSTRLIWCPSSYGQTDPKKTARKLVNATPNIIEVSLLAKTVKSNQRLHGRYSPFVILVGFVADSFHTLRLHDFKKTIYKVTSKSNLSLSCSSIS